MMDALDIFITNTPKIIFADEFRNIITLVTSLVNIYIAFRVYQYTKRDINPKIYVDSTILSSEESSNIYIYEMLNEELINEDFKRKGFPEVRHKNMLWQLNIVNNGDHPATNVVVDYSIIIKKAEFEFGYDEADIINEKFVDYKVINRKVMFDYIPPNADRKTYILELDGRFPKADLIINKLVSSEMDFINKPIELDNYEHPDFNMLQDSYHGRRMFGVNYKD